MTDSRTQSLLDRDRLQLGYWLALYFVWALINTGAVGLGISPVLDGGLLDSDSYMRLVRVDLLYQTGAWYDGNIPRSNAPYGDILHWTRLFDAVLLCYPGLSPRGFDYTGCFHDERATWTPAPGRRPARVKSLPPKSHAMPARTRRRAAKRRVSSARR